MAFSLPFYVFQTLHHMLRQLLSPLEISLPLTLRFQRDKTLKTRDEIHLVTVPKLLCPILRRVKALQQTLALYSPVHKIHCSKDWVVLIDSRIRKVLAMLKVKKASKG